MPKNEAWRCGSCATLNLPFAGSCRRCGASRRAAAARARSRDSAGLAAVLSFLLPGLGQVYTRRAARGLILVLVPAAVAGVAVGLLLLFDPLMALAVRASVAVASGAVALLAAYHATVILDSFAAPSTRGRGLGRRLAEYAALGAVAVVFVILYVALFRQTTAWAALAERVFEPFHREAPAPDLPQWRGDDRLNILLLGIDTRRGATTVLKNSDTIIVLTVDPLNRGAGMLSIPRDTLVEIPGHGEQKINAAYALGGADLARRTVSALLGVPVHGYALIDFEGFQRVIEAVDGVLVDAPLPVRDEAYPTEDFGVTRLAIRAGPQMMDGRVALHYARSRHGSNDFSRAERQQRVLTALKRRASETALLFRLPTLVDELSEAVRTDVDPGNAIPLARLAADVEARDIETRVLRPPTGEGGGELREVSSPAAYYLVPVPSRIRETVAELFYDPRVRHEAARVEIRAPAAREALARTVAGGLERRRFTIVGLGVTPPERGTTVVIRDATKRYTAERLARLLGGTVRQVGIETDADIAVLLGDDFQGLVAAP